MKTLRREIHPQIKVLDEAQGIVEYIASNETMDSYSECIRADGWLFDDFQKNAPFVDSHDYSSIDNCLGRVVDFAVRKKQLIETVKWAIDVPTNLSALKGFAMTAAGYLKAVSVGFMPIKYVTPYDRDPAGWQENCQDMGLDPNKTPVRCIYVQQQQKELSACVLGANPDAVARAYKAGILDDAFLERISTERAKRTIADSTDGPAAVEKARQRVRTAVIVDLLNHINSL